MNLAELIADLDVVSCAESDTARDITSIVEDSRQVVPGSLFIARQGDKVDGRLFIPNAIAQGAVAVLTDHATAVPAAAVKLVADDVPLAAAHLVERFHGNPSRRLQLIAITGTNGKTTTAYLVRHLWNAVAGGGATFISRSAGSRSGRCGLIGTVEIDNGCEVIESELTTPPAIEISRQLRAMLDNGCSACVMEASSHALDQRRTAGLSITVGIFTNLTGDHLDYHHDRDQYATAKARLFESLPTSGTAIINLDDPTAHRMTQDCKAGIIWCSVNDPTATAFAEIRRLAADGADVAFHGPWGVFDLQLPLVGRHNVMNALQAVAALYALGVPANQIGEALSQASAPPGRLELASTTADDLTVLVDYAHTDDALDNVLTALRNLLPHGSSKKLRVVFGCGGDRDPTKRPRMAAVAARHADEIIITSDNPRTENPQSIVEQIAAGVPGERAADTLCILDRRAAINTAIERSEPGDVILIAGKGHETYQILGSTKHPFDDRQVARAALADRRGRLAPAAS